MYVDYANPLPRYHSDMVMGCETSSKTSASKSYKPTADTKAGSTPFFVHFRIFHNRITCVPSFFPSKNTSTARPLHHILYNPLHLVASGSAGRVPGN